MMIATMTKNYRMRELSEHTRETVSELSPILAVQGEINNDGVTAVVDLVYKLATDTEQATRILKTPSDNDQHLVSTN